MSKIQDLKKRYPDLVLDIIDALSKHDPSGKNKYLEFLLKHSIDYIRDFYLSGTVIAESHVELLDMVRDFDKYCQLNLIENKDIYSYPSLEALYEALKESKKLYDDKMMKERESLVLFETDTCLLIKPLTRRTSEIYGKQTEWCTAFTKSNNRFQEYASSGTLVYLIFKKPDQNLPEKWEKLAFNRKTGTEKGKIWDAKDVELAVGDTMRLARFIPPEILILMDIEFQLNIPNTRLTIEEDGSVTCHKTELNKEERFIAEKHFQAFQPISRKITFVDAILKQQANSSIVSEDEHDWFKNLMDTNSPIDYTAGATNIKQTYNESSTAMNYLKQWSKYVTDSAEIELESENENPLIGGIELDAGEVTEERVSEEEDLPF